MIKSISLAPFYSPYDSDKCKPYSDLTIENDISFGEEGEDTVKLMLEKGQLIEVKTERDIWKSTGNMVIEYEFKGEPSGIAHTKADWWFHNFVFEDKLEFTLVFKTEVLKQKLRTLWLSGDLKAVKGGDGNNSSMLLVPIKAITKGD